jgi:F-type H+-transporting ATPase subunit c
MDNTTTIAVVSMISASCTTFLGCVWPAIQEGRAIVAGLNAIAQQPDAAPVLTRALFVGLAMIESIAIYCFVVSMILIFANPFWDFVTQKAG